MTYEFKIKCRACGLHYTVLSWNIDWPTLYPNKGGFCPECGTKGSKIVWGPDERDEQIFSIVPGSTGIISLT